MKYNMFSKNNESVSSSEHTANKKNLSIYVNRNNSRHAIVKNDMVCKSLNYAERYNMYKGFVHCKKINSTGNENCFTIQHDNEVDSYKKNHMEDYHLSRVDYFDLEDTTTLTNKSFPYSLDAHERCFKETIPEQHTFFDPGNNHRTTSRVKNFKYGHSMSNLK